MRHPATASESVARIRKHAINAKQLATRDSTRNGSLHTIAHIQLNGFAELKLQLQYIQARPVAKVIIPETLMP